MRIAVVTPLSPTVAEPYRGLPIIRTVSALRDYANVGLFWLQPRFRIVRPSSFLASESLAIDSLPGVPMQYITYPAVALLSRPFNGYVGARSLYNPVRRFWPDVILAYWLYPEGLSAVRVGRCLRIPVVLGARGSDLRFLPGPMSRQQVRTALRGCSMLLTVSDELRSVALNQGLAPEQVRTVANGVDKDDYRPRDRLDARAELGVPQDAEIVLFVGRLHPVKGLGDLLEAIRSLRHRRPKLRLVVIGTGPLSQGLSRRASTELQGQMDLLGHQAPAAVSIWLAASNLLCLPSISEGCPNVVLEALLSARPVVASAVGGIPEMVDENCAILVPPRNPARLAEALDQALSREWDPSAFSKRCGRTWRDVGRETYEACVAVLARRSASAGIVA